MQKSLLAGISIPNLSSLKNPVVPPKTQDTVPSSLVVPTASHAEPATTADIHPEPEPTESSAAPLYEGKPRRKAGRPRINPDRPLTGWEKTARYRQRHKALSADALAGTINPAGLSNKDLCSAVARMLNQKGNLVLRQTGYPLVKELQRRLKSL